MQIFRYCPALALLLALGCASTPEEITAGGGAQLTEGAVAASTEAPTSVEVVDVNDFDPNSTIQCREMLKQGSNVIVTRCMSRADWKRFERQQAYEAASIVRMLQGGAYR